MNVITVADFCHVAVVVVVGLSRTGMSDCCLPNSDQRHCIYDIVVAW